MEFYEIYSLFIKKKFTGVGGGGRSSPREFIKSGQRSSLDNYKFRALHIQRAEGGRKKSKVYWWFLNL